MLVALQGTGIPVGKLALYTALGGEESCWGTSLHIINYVGFVQLLRNAVPLDIRKKRKNLLDLFFLSWDLLGATLCFCMLVSKVLERRRKLCDYKFVLLHASTGMNFIDNKNLNLNYIWIIYLIEKLKYYMQTQHWMWFYCRERWWSYTGNCKWSCTSCLISCPWQDLKEGWKECPS